MKDNLEFLVYELAGTHHNTWTTPKNIWGIMQINYPEITLEMIEDACKSLCVRKLLEDMIYEGETFYRRTHIWYALGLPERDRYGI